MCWYTDQHGKCYPGTSRLQAMTGLSESTVKRTRRELAEKNLLRQQRRTSKAGDATSNVYRVNLDKLAALAPSGRRFDDDDLLGELGFADESYSQVTGALDRPKGHHDPTPHDPGGVTTNPPGSTMTGGGVTTNPPPVTTNPPGGHSEPLSVIRSVTDPVDDPIRSASRPRTTQDHGRTDISSTPDTRTRSSLNADAELIINALPLGTVDAKPTQVQQIRVAIRTALRSGISASALLNYLRTKVADARTVKYVLTSLHPHYLAELAATPALTTSHPQPPQVCGHCDARDGDDIAARTITIGEEVVKCPDCHPYSTPLPVS